MNSRKVAIVGIGNVLLGDDGLGVRAIQALRSLGGISGVDLMDAGTSVIDTLPVFVDNHAVIVIDALRGGSLPGTVYRMVPEDLRRGAVQDVSLHDVQILEVVGMAALLGAHPTVVILGVEPHDMSLGLTLTNAVRRAVPIVVELARREAARLQAGPPGVRALASTAGS